VQRGMRRPRRMGKGVLSVFYTPPPHLLSLSFLFPSEPDAGKRR